jgi:dethiobiotin synthetase
MRGLFVTGSDTGAGKTVLSAALLAAMAAAGEPVRAHKPVVTGLDETLEPAAEGAWPDDHRLLGLAAGMEPEQVAPLRYGPAASPHLAARLAGEPIERAALLAVARSARAEADAAGAALVVEGVGGLLVPLADDFLVRDFAHELGMAVVIAARPGLGTLNHTLLTIEAARAAGLSVRAVVLTPWPAAPDPIELSNRETIERLGALEVQTLGLITCPERGELARAGSRLPWQRWLEPAAA